MSFLNKRRIEIGNIPAILWGKASDKIYIFVHGKGSNKESAHKFAQIAEDKGYQVLSFDLPEHGERKNENYKCDVFNGVQELKIVWNYVEKKWTSINLFGCSLGAYFSLITYKDYPIDKCLFQSPIVDMEHLIGKMFEWFNVTEELLREKKKIATPIDILSWDYYCYVKQHPIIKWNVPTSIIYGTKDNLQSSIVIEDFVKRFKSKLTISVNSEHDFHTSKSEEEVIQWLNKYI